MSSNGVSIGFQNDGGKATSSNGVSISFQNAQQGSTANSNGVSVAFDGYCDGAPRITKQPRGATVLNNQSVTLEVETETLYAPTLQWHKGDSGDTSQRIEGATSDALTINSVAANSRTNYWVQVINQCGTANSQTMTVAAIDKLPLIFVPGIGGSKLEKIGVPNLNVFPNLFFEQAENALSLEPGNTPFPTVIAPDVFRSADICVPFTSQCLRYEVYKPMLNWLATDGGYREYKEDNSVQDANLFAFPYDWRLSNKTNAASLRLFVRSVRERYRDYPEIKINILAHSMGGLLARRYILDTPDHAVEKLITVGSPWLGAPKAINILETGQFIELILGRTPFFDSRIKTLAEFFPGVHELLPSKAYYDFEPRAFIEQGWDTDGDGNAYETYDYNNLKSMLDTRYRSRAGSANSDFHNFVNRQSNKQDDWRLDTSGVQYYHMVGLRKSADTIGGILTKQSVVYCRTGTQIYACGHKQSYKLDTTTGDGTVPFVSAFRRRGNINYNAQNAKLITFSVNAGNSRDDDASHNGMMKNYNVFRKIIDSIGEPLNQNQSKSFIGTSESLESDEQAASPAYYFQISNASNVIISDSTGNTLNPFTGEQSENAPNIVAYPLDNRNLLTVVPLEETIAFTFTTTDELATLELTKGTDIATSEAVRYLDVNVPANTKVKIELSPSGIGALQYDGDGDGTFESMVQPTASVSGNAAQDTQSPTVSVKEVPLAAIRRVTITATDEGAGVKSVFYSLDGTNFQPYNGAFEINPTQTTTVYVFAEDNVANRSSLTTYSVKKRRKGRVRRGSRDGF